MLFFKLTKESNLSPLFLQFKWSRKGFIRTRFNIQNTWVYSLLLWVYIWLTKATFSLIHIFNRIQKNHICHISLTLFTQYGTPCFSIAGPHSLILTHGIKSLVFGQLSHGWTELFWLTGDLWSKATKVTTYKIQYKARTCIQSVRAYFENFHIQ